MAAIHKLRDEQLRKQHSTELQNQQEYTERQQKELRKRHALQTKQLPRSINVSFSLYFNLLGAVSESKGKVE